MSESVEDNQPQSPLRTVLARAGSASVAINLLNAFLSLLTGIALARLLGPDGYGIYSFVITMSVLALIPAQFGSPTVVSRETTQATVAGRWDLAKGAWRWAILVATVGCVVVTLCWFALWKFSPGDDSAMLHTPAFIAGILLVGALAAVNYFSCILRGLYYVVKAMLSTLVLIPLLFLIIIGGIYISTEGLTSEQAVASQVVATLVVAFVAGIMFLRARPAEARQTKSSTILWKAWSASAVILALNTSMIIVSRQIDIVMLGFMAPANEVGIYRAGSRLSEFVAFGLVAVSLVITPYAVRFVEENDKVRLQKLVTQAARVSMSIALLASIVFLVAGHKIIEVLFGEEYEGSWAVLMLLTVGQLALSTMGPIFYVLTVTHHERVLAKITLFTSVVNVALNYYLISSLGMIGAAYATLAVLLLQCPLFWWAAKSRLGINASPFARLPIE